jgi:transposase
VDTKLDKLIANLTAMKKINQHYNLDFKIKAVELSYQRGNLQEIADELTISRESLRNWRKLAKEGKLGLKTSKLIRVKTKEEEENHRLKKELYDVSLERDILKKALCIFSKSDK